MGKVGDKLSPYLEKISALQGYIGFELQDNGSFLFIFEADNNESSQLNEILNESELGYWILLKEIDCDGEGGGGEDDFASEVLRGLHKMSASCSDPMPLPFYEKLVKYVNSNSHKISGIKIVDGDLVIEMLEGFEGFPEEIGYGGNSYVIDGNIITISVARDGSEEVSMSAFIPPLNSFLSIKNQNTDPPVEEVSVPGDVLTEREDDSLSEGGSEASLTVSGRSVDTSYMRDVGVLGLTVESDYPEK